MKSRITNIKNSSMKLFINRRSMSTEPVNWLRFQKSPIVQLFRLPGMMQLIIAFGQGNDCPQKLNGKRQQVGKAISSIPGATNQEIEIWPTLTVSGMARKLSWMSHHFLRAHPPTDYSTWQAMYESGSRTGTMQNITAFHLKGILKDQTQEY